MNAMCAMCARVPTLTHIEGAYGVLGRTWCEEARTPMSVLGAMCALKVHVRPHFVCREDVGRRWSEQYDHP